MDNLQTDSLLESDIFQVARVFSIKKNYDKFRLFAKLCMERGQVAQSFITFNNKLPGQEKDFLLNAELDGKKKYFSLVDKDIHDQIKEMVIVDSKVRELNLIKKLSYAVVRTIDSVNIISIRHLIAKHGMITERKHGALFNDFFYLINHCMHYDYKDFEWMRKLLYEAVLNGDVKPDLYAYFVDRFEVINKRLQIYGTFATITQIADKKNVDVRRQQIGTCNLNQWILLRKGRM